MVKDGRGYVRFYGVRWRVGLRTMKFRMNVCERYNVLGYVPCGIDVVAVFKTIREAKQTQMVLRTKNHYSHYVGEVWVWETNLNRKDKFWHETEKGIQRTPQVKC